MAPNDQLAESGKLAETDDLEQRARPFQALYEHWERNQWSPQSLDFSRDRSSFLALEDERRDAFMWIFAHRFHAEYKVATVLAPFLLRAPDYDLQLVLSTQIADEYRHMQAVFRVYEAVFGISAPGEVRAIADAHLDVIASTLYDALDRTVKPLETSDDPDDFLTAIVAYHLVAEGVIARTAQTLAAEQYEAFGDFPGLAEGQRLVSRDEARHIGIGVSYCRRRMAEDRGQREGGHHGLRRVLRRSVVGPAGNGARRRHGHTGPVRIRRRGGGVLRRGNAVLADAPSLDRLHRVAPPPVRQAGAGGYAAGSVPARRISSTAALTLLVDAPASLGDALPRFLGRLGCGRRRCRLAGRRTALREPPPELLGPRIGPWAGRRERAGGARRRGRSPTP